MRWIVILAKPMMTGLLVAAPIGNTTVLLLFSFSLETLLTLLLLRKRRRRLATAAVARQGPGILLRRTVPQLRGRRPASPETFAPAPASSSRWRTAPSGATS
jgi:hypothetical protein